MSNNDIAPSTTPFFTVPTVTSTIPIHLDINVLGINVAQSSTSSASGVIVTNPSDPSQIAHFESLIIPESQRIGLPNVMTDTAPAALEIYIGEMGLLALLFANDRIVFPASPQPAWLKP
jgi:hypothetical protein